MDLPGFHKEDVKIQLKDGYLNIQASRTENKDERTIMVNMSTENVTPDSAPEVSM